MILKFYCFFYILEIHLAVFASHLKIIIKKNIEKTKQNKTKTGKWKCECFRGEKRRKKLTCGSTDPQLSACFRSFNSTCALVLSMQTTSSTLCGRTMSCFFPSSTMKNRWGLEGMKEIRDERIKLKDRNREGKVRESWEEGARRAEAKVNRLEKENQVMRSKEEVLVKKWKAKDRRRCETEA